MSDVPIGAFLRAAMSDHDMTTPCSPAELRTLAAEMEDSLIEGECGFSHPDWRYVDGLRALAETLEHHAPEAPAP